MDRGGCGACNVDWHNLVRIGWLCGLCYSPMLDSADSSRALINSLACPGGRTVVTFQVDRLT